MDAHRLTTGNGCSVPVLSCSFIVLSSLITGNAWLWNHSIGRPVKCKCCRTSATFCTMVCGKERMISAPTFFGGDLASKYARERCCSVLHMPAYEGSSKPRMTRPISRCSRFLAPLSRARNLDCMSPKEWALGMTSLRTSLPDFAVSLRKPSVRGLTLGADRPRNSRTRHRFAFPGAERVWFHDLDTRRHRLAG